MFDKKILPLSDSLYRTARSILQDADEAHDAVQDLLMSLWEKRSELAGVDNLNAIIRMRDVEEMEIQEIADITEITPNVLTADSSANVGNLISDINNVTTRQNYEKVVEVRDKGETVNIYFKELSKNKTELLVVNNEKSGTVNLILISGNITPEEFEKLNSKDKNKDKNNK